MYRKAEGRINVRKSEGGNSEVHCSGARVGIALNAYARGCAKRDQALNQRGSLALRSGSRGRSNASAPTCSVGIAKFFQDWWVGRINLVLVIALPIGQVST